MQAFQALWLAPEICSHCGKSRRRVILHLSKLAPLIELEDLGTYKSVDTLEIIQAC